VLPCDPNNESLDPLELIFHTTVRTELSSMNKTNKKIILHTNRKLKKNIKHYTL